MKARVSTEPGCHSRMFVSSIIVHDQMEIEVARCLDVDFLEKSNELLVPMTRHAVANDLAVEHTQGSKERRGTIAFVIVSHGPATALLQGKAWLGAIECLNLAFFVDTEHYGLVRWIEIEPDNIDEFLDKVLVATEFETLHQMRLEVVLPPYPTYGGFAHALGRSHRSRAPVRRIGRRGVESRLDDSFDFAR